GQPIVGVEQAARYFFGRSAIELNLYESAILAGLLKAPSYYNFLKYPDRARKRAIVVLSAMVEQGYVTEAEKAHALKAPRAKGSRKPISFEPRSFMEWVLSDIKASDPGIQFTPRTRIPITLEIITQARAEAAMANALRPRIFGLAEAGYVVMGFDGRVVSMIGQRNHAKSQRNHVTQAHRQPASTFKAFVYGAGLEAGIISMSNDLKDNFANSRNDPARIIANKVGTQQVADFAKRMGI
ncbi:MAG: transglycosylase domain-containing protein, partial [Coleofasciculus sp. C2-GNP5-27]